MSWELYYLIVSHKNTQIKGAYRISSGKPTFYSTRFDAGITALNAVRSWLA